MVWIEKILFESPWMVIVVLAIVWALMRIVGRRTNNKKIQRASWIPLALLAVLWFTASMVTTKRELLAETLDALLLATEDKDMQTFREIVLPEAKTQIPKEVRANLPNSFKGIVPGNVITRDQFIALLEAVTIKDLILLSSAVEQISTTEGVTYMRLRAEGSVGGGAPGLELSEWAIRWRYVDDRWKVLWLECTAYGPHTIFKDQ